MPTPPPSSHPAPAGDQILRRALEALRTRRPLDAEKLASLVLADAPGNGAAARILGQAMLMLRRHEEAIAPLSRAAKGLDDPATRVLFARALNGAGRFQEALAALREAAAYRPPFVPAFLELADQLGRLGRVEEAVNVMRDATRLAPDDPVPRMGLGYIHLRAGDRANARVMFAEVRAMAPDRHDAMVALATALRMDGDAVAATELFRRALAVRPDDQVTRIDLARCLLETGDRGAADAMLRDAAAHSAQLAAQAITTLAAAPHGRLFLRPSAAAKFLLPGGA